MPVLAVLTCIALGYYLVRKEGDLRVLKRGEVAVADLLKLGLEGRLQSVLSDLAFLANGQEVERAFPADGSDDEEGTVLLARLFQRFAETHRMYDQIRLIDADGGEKIRINGAEQAPFIVPAEELQDKSNRYYFDETMGRESGSVYVSPLDLNLENGVIEEPHKPMLRFGTPIFDAMGKGRGILMFNFLGKELLEVFDELDAGSRGDLMLVNSDGFWCRSSEADSDWGWMFEERKGRSFAALHPDAWSRISKDKRGQIRTARGIYTYVTIQVPPSEALQGQARHWKGISFVPRAVYAEEFQKIASWLLLCWAGAVTLAGSGSWRLGLAQSLRRQHEAALEQSRERAIATSQSKSELLANLSHEIRTPINGVIVMTELLLDSPLDSKQKDYTRLAKDSAGSLLILLNDLLDLSKIEAGQLNLDPHPFHLRTMLEETFKGLSARAEYLGLALRYEIAPEIPEILRGDSARLRQILENLVGTAVKFTPEGEIIVKVKEVAADESGYGIQLRFEITNPGFGLSRELRARVFDAFTREDGTRASNHGSAGLGLAVSSQLVRIMGGRIRVDTDSGVGSRFQFTLPFGHTKEDPASARQLKNSLRGIRVLVVSDNVSQQKMLDDLFRKWEMKPLLATGGEEALKLVGQKFSSFRVILIDRLVPDMDGLELAEAVTRQTSGEKKPCVILFIPRGKTVSESRLRQAGVDRCLEETVLPNELISIISESLFGRTESDESKNPKPRTTKPMEVLLVERGSMNQAVVIRLLESRGHSVKVVNTVEQAMDYTEKRSFDAILVDVRSPDSTELATVAQLRKREQEGGSARIPIIAMSARAGALDLEKCQAVGMDALVSIPLDSALLFQVLENGDAGSVTDLQETN